MKLFLAALSLVLFLTQAQAGALSTLLDDDKPSSSMSDEDLSKDPFYQNLSKSKERRKGVTKKEVKQKLLEAYRELHDKNTVAFYQKKIVETLKENDAKTGFIQKHFSDTTGILYRCLLVEKIDADSSDRSEMFDRHLGYFTRAFGLVIDQPDLEAQNAKERKELYDQALLYAKKTLLGDSKENKKRYTAEKDSCNKMASNLLNISDATRTIDVDAAKALTHKKLDALVQKRWQSGKMKEFLMGK
ncbi:hypothetical protein [Candidatus Thioglobus sp.]|uniref:hypothetical protein n=1 Tax=Candidatus Thioglobus sp. TaxID=2026721 RepID=UPI003D0ABC33